VHRSTLPPLASVHRDLLQLSSHSEFFNGHTAYPSTTGVLRAYLRDSFGRPWWPTLPSGTLGGTESPYEQPAWKADREGGSDSDILGRKIQSPVMWGFEDDEACGEGQLGEETNEAEGGSHPGSGVRVHASNGLRRGAKTDSWVRVEAVGRGARADIPRSSEREGRQSSSVSADFRTLTLEDDELRQKESDLLAELPAWRRPKRDK
jgi:hypothetical protein